MVNLVLTVLLDQVAQLRFVVAKLRALFGVVFVDHFLDRRGARHRGLLAHHRGGRAECVAGNVPHRGQRGRPHPAFGDQPVEGREMLAFLRRHFLDHRSGRGFAEHRELALVDAHGAEFPRLIDPDDARDQLLGRRIAGQQRVAVVRGGGWSWSARLSVMGACPGGPWKPYRLGCSDYTGTPVRQVLTYVAGRVMGAYTAMSANSKRWGAALALGLTVAAGAANGQARYLQNLTRDHR